MRLPETASWHTTTNEGKKKKLKYKYPGNLKYRYGRFFGRGVAVAVLEPFQNVPDNLNAVGRLWATAGENPQRSFVTPTTDYPSSFRLVRSVLRSVVNRPFVVYDILTYAD